MHWRALRMTIITMLVMLPVLLATGTASAQNTSVATYEVTLQNLTSGQPFSPPVAATHDENVRMFEVGQLASDELAAIAQDGNQVPMFDLVDGLDQVTDAVNVGRPLTPNGVEAMVDGMTFTDTVTFEITAMQGDVLSLATMLICTNDGFLGLDSVALPASGTVTYALDGYDAGREDNTELSQDIVDPCSGLGPMPLAGDPDGNEDEGVATTPADVITHHPGIQGDGELDAVMHGWTDPVAMVTVTRVDGGNGDCMQFPETGHSLCGDFLAFWEANGGLPVFGFPMTDAMDQENPDTGETYLSQYFERQRFELHPENAGTVYHVLLGRLGAQVLDMHGRDWMSFEMGNPSDPHFVAETGHSVAPMFWDYWSSHGLEYGDAGISFRESLLLFGYPLSEPMMETNMDGDTVLTQWFERATFELHPDNEPGQQVLLRRVGAELLEGSEPTTATYQVTIENLTNGQPFSPPVAATHGDGVRMFQVGELASDELAAIAQGGNQIPMFDLVGGSDMVTDAVNVGMPLTPNGVEAMVDGMTFTDTVTFEITAMPGDLLSLATMLICTNDGFLGLDSVMLPSNGTMTYTLDGYDAGVEDNTELSEDIVDPCSGLGPMPLMGDPDGNDDEGVATSPPSMITHHPGIQGDGELSVDEHGWTDPVARVTITRLPTN